MSEWISVEDQAPPRNGEYLTYNPYSIYCCIQVNCFYRPKWESSNGYVTHWMPLPEPPEDV